MTDMTVKTRLVDNLEEINPLCAESVSKCGLCAIAIEIAGEDDHYQFVEVRNRRNTATAIYLTRTEAFWFMQGIWTARAGQ
jgi:hypothetical protein